MPLEYLMPSADFVFKKIFGAPANKDDILKDFLQSILDIPHCEWLEIDIDNSKIDKSNVVDLHISTKTLGLVKIKMQKNSYPATGSQLVYHISRMVLEQSADCVKQKNIIIFITEYPCVENSSKYHNVYLLREKNGLELTKTIEIHTIELSKLAVKFDGCNLWYWLKFLSTNSENDLAYLSVAGPKSLKRAINTLKRLSKDKKACLNALDEEVEKIDFAMEYEKSINKYIDEAKILWLAKSICTISKNYNIPVDKVMYDLGIEPTKRGTLDKKISYLSDNENKNML